MTQPQTTPRGHSYPVSVPVPEHLETSPPAEPFEDRAFDSGAPSLGHSGAVPRALRSDSFVFRHPSLCELRHMHGVPEQIGARTVVPAGRSQSLDEVAL